MIWFTSDLYLRLTYFHFLNENCPPTQGSKSKDVIITVKSKARIENLPNLQYLITGQESIIVCEVSGYPFPTVEWRVNGKRIETFNSHGYSVRGTNLVINNPTRNVHDGLYTCKSSNDYGSDQQMSRVEVVDMPSISRVNGCGAVKAGLECEMMCEAAGSPLPDLSWRYKDGLNDSVIAVSDDVRHFVTMTDSEGAELRRLTFTIKDLREDDAGIYYCHAEWVYIYIYILCSKALSLYLPFPSINRAFSPSPNKHGKLFLLH